MTWLGAEWVDSGKVCSQNVGADLRKSNLPLIPLETQFVCAVARSHSARIAGLINIRIYDGRRSKPGEVICSSNSAGKVKSPWQVIVSSFFGVVN
jgi:hypothetical protein